MMLSELTGGVGRGTLFGTTLRKPAGGKLGFAGVPMTVNGLSSIHIRSLASGGAIDIHNRTCEPGKVICPGDYIVRIGSSVMDPHDMMELLVAAEEIQLCILRRGGSGTALDSSLQGCKESSGADLQHDLSEVSTVAPASMYPSVDSIMGEASSADSILGRLPDSFAAEIGLSAAQRFGSTPSASGLPASTYQSLDSNVGEASDVQGLLGRLPDSFAAEIGLSGAQRFGSTPSASGLPASNYQSLDSNVGEASDVQGLLGRLPDSFAAAIGLAAGDHAQGSSGQPGAPDQRGVTSGRQAAKGAAGHAKSSRRMTTIMLRQLPPMFSRSMILRLLDQEGYAGLYDFVYMPTKFGTQKAFSYAFVNFTTPEAAEVCRTALDGYSRWDTPHDKECIASWADSEQGLEANIRRYRNSPVMHESVPDECKPVLFKDGLRIPFPPPTKTLKAPSSQKKASAEPLAEEGQR